MAMQNAPVKFRRGQSANLPEDITDGYISIDSDNGQAYADIDDGYYKKRIAVNGCLFGVSYTSEDQTTKTVDVIGVPYYFDGLSVTVVFSEIDKTNYDPLYLSIDNGTTALPSVALMITEDTTMSGAEIEPGVPYTFVYRGGMFIMNSGSVVSRPKWKPIDRDADF